MRIKSGFIVLFALVATQAAAAEWRAFAGDAKSIHFFDSTSVVADLPRHHRIWTETIRAKPGADSVKTVRTQWRIDCAGRTMGIAAVVDYDKGGKSMRASVVEPTQIKEVPTVPDTVGDAIRMMACDGSAGWSLASIGVYRENAATADAFFRLLEAGIDPLPAMMFAAVPPEVAEEALSSEAGQREFGAQEEVIRATLGLGTPL